MSVIRKKFYAHVIIGLIQLLHLLLELKGLFEFGEQGRLKGPTEENSEIS